MPTNGYFTTLLMALLLRSALANEVILLSRGSEALMAAISESIAFSQSHTISSATSHNDQSTTARDHYSPMLKILLLSTTTANYAEVKRNGAPTNTSSGISPTERLTQHYRSVTTPKSTTEHTPKQKKRKSKSATPNFQGETFQFITTHGTPEIADSVELLYQDFIYPPYSTTTPFAFNESIDQEKAIVQTQTPHVEYGSKETGQTTVLIAMVAIVGLTVLALVSALCYSGSKKSVDQHKLDVYYIELP